MHYNSNILEFNNLEKYVTETEKTTTLKPILPLFVMHAYIVEDVNFMRI